MSKFVEYKTHGTCSSHILVEYDGQKILKVQFVGGCPGNTLGVAKLVEGMSVEEAIARLRGIDCNGRGTSCPDQLARALEQTL